MLLSLFLLFLGTFSHASELKNKNVFIPHHVGEVGLIYTNGNFLINKNGKKVEIKNYDVDPLLRKMNNHQLNKFLMNNSIIVNQLSNNDYTLKAKVHGNGGGPILGAIGYWAFKSVCYGTMAAGTGVAVASAGASIGAVVGAKVAAIGTNMAIAGTTNVIGGMGTMGATGVATAIVEAGVAQEALVGTVVVAADVATKAGSMWGIVSAIEGAALAVDAILTALPTP